jgi:hypothetical protein
MNKKSFLILTLIVVLFSNASGQKQQSKNLAKFDHRVMHFGFLLGINSTNFVLERQPETFSGSDSLFVLEAKPATGFNLGIISSLHLSEAFSIRFTPNLAFASRTLNYNFETYEGPKKYSKIIESTLINLPLGVKYKSVRVNNFSAYILVGGAYSMDLASNVGNDNNSNNPSDVVVAIKKHDYLAEIAFGTDFYLEYFKFGIELKMSYGFKDLLDHDNAQFTDPIDKLKSKMFLLSLTFEG